MEAREVTGRALARAVPCDPGLISRYINGKQWPSRKIARRLDDVLESGGQLAATACVDGLTPDDEERLALAAATPRRADGQAARSLSVMLAEAGLAAIAPDVRESEWAAWYLAGLATAYRALGERAESAKTAAEVARIAAATVSPRLAARATVLQHSLRSLG